MIPSNWVPQQFELPYCAVCQRPVESLTAFRPFDRMVTSYTAYCHGVQETVEVSDQDVCNGRVELGIAFAQKALEGEKK